MTARPPYLARAELTPKCPKSVRVLSSGRAVTPSRDSGQALTRRLAATSPIKGEGIIGADVGGIPDFAVYMCVSHG